MTRHRRRALIWLAITGLILSTFVAAAPALGTNVTPSLHQGNPTCGDLGDYDHEFKVDPVTGGLHEDPASDFEVTLTLHNTADGQTFDWVSNLPVDAVFVKGGPGGNLYIYNGATSDTGLHAPGNDQGTAVSTPPWSGLSHISFCFNDVPDESVPESVPESESQPESVPESESQPESLTEGSVGGGTGTPAASVPDTATSLPGFGGPLATLIFGAILVASLGTLAYANVRAAKQRR